MLFDRMAGRIMPPASRLLVPRFVVRRASTRALARRERFVEEAIGMIRREACSGLTVGKLASRFPCSRALFDLRFRETTGHSAYDEILGVRLDRVDSMLVNTDVSISAVASFCGFESESALRHLFRRRTGMSPRRWRQSHR